MHTDPGGRRPPPPDRLAGTDAHGAPLVYFDGPVPTSWTAGGGPGSWDDTIRDAITYDRERQQIRSLFAQEIRGWNPGTLVDLSELVDLAAQNLVRRFVRLARTKSLRPIQTCFKSSGLVRPVRPRATARTLQCWPLLEDYSWALLLPNGQLALQVPPEEYSSIVPAGATTALTVAGINAPSPYGLTAEAVAESIISWCKIHRLHW